MKQKRVLITGGRGYIGCYLAEEIKSRGAEVFITSRFESNDKHCRRMDLLDDSSVMGVCEGMDAIFHLANLDELLVKEQPKNALLANAFATRQLYLDAVLQGANKFIYFSTFHVYGRNFGEIDEKTTPNPKGDYGLTHYFAEEYLRQLSDIENLPVAVIRLTNGIGAPCGDYKWYLALNDFCRTVYNTREIVLKSNGLPQRDFVPIKDAAKAAVILSEIETDSRFEVYNISSEFTYSIRELALAVAEVYEKRYGKKTNLKIPNVSREEIDAVKPLKVYSQKIRKLGWQPTVSLDEVINDIFDVLERGY